MLIIWDVMQPCPSTRLASALVLQQTQERNLLIEPSVDVVHTELCTLHFNPLSHSPEQLVVQSLFADGFVRYRVQQSAPRNERSLKILSMNEEQIPNSAEAMTLAATPLGHGHDFVARCACADLGVCS